MGGQSVRRWDAGRGPNSSTVGPRLARRLGGIPGALARRTLNFEHLSQADGPMRIVNFLRENGYASDGLDKRLTATRRYEMLIRGRNETLQAFYLRENTLITDMVKASCAPSESSRAHNMLTKSGLTNDQIIMVYSHVMFTSPADAQELTPAKVQATVLKLYGTTASPGIRSREISRRASSSTPARSSARVQHNRGLLPIPTT